MFEFL